MSRPKRKLDEATLIRAKEELSRLKDGRVAIKLKAIIAYYELPAKRVAQVLQTSRPTIHLWVDRFKKEGVEGLRDKPKGHYLGKLKEEHKERIQEWLISSKCSEGKVVHWTLKSLQEEIEKVFGIKISHTGIWKNLKKMGFNLKKPRPRSYKADISKQEEYKKK
jgi:putative transposase